MRNTISVTVSADHRVCCPEWDIARTGENECTRFEITLAEELSTYSAYIDFEKPDGEKFKTPRMNIENNRIIYDLPSAVLDVKGNLLVQLVLQNDEGEIWKSNVQKFYVSESVDATEAIVEKDDFVADIEKRVKELNVGLKNKVDKLDTNNVVYATDNSTPAKTIGIQYMESPLEGTIPIRDGIGSLQVPTAQDATQAVNKGQMDTALDGKVNKTNKHLIFYGTDDNGKPYYYRQDAMDSTKWSVPIRNGYGAIVAGAAQQDNEVITKKQLDTGLVKKLDANGLSTEAAQYGMSDIDSTKIKSNTTTILNLNTSDDTRGYGSSYYDESGWHISPNVINSSDSFSMTNANVYLESSKQEGIIGVNTTKNLPSGEVCMGAIFDGHGLHLERGLNGVATTLDITRDSIKRNDTTETWENILSVPSKLDNKINKTSELNKLYGTQENGYQYLYNISKNVDPHSAVQRTEFGTIKAEYPRDDNDVATQASVNAGLNKKLNRVNKESDYLSVYAVTDTGGDAFLKQRSDEALAWSVPLRFRQGQILAARSDIEKDPEKLKDSNGNPIDTDNFLVTQGQLKEVDTKINNMVQKTNSTYILYGTTGKDSAGATIQSELPFRSTVSNYSIAQRTDTGQLKAATPIEKEDLTTKEYVDNLVQGSTENGVFTGSITIGNPDADTTGGTNTVIADTSIDMWSRAGGEELKITLGNDPDVYYRNNGQSKSGSAKFEDIVNVANAYAGASFYLTPFTVDNLKADTIEVQDALILKSPNGTKYKITVADDGTLSTAKVD